MIARRLLTALSVALIVATAFTFWLSRKFVKPAHAESKQQEYVATAHGEDAGTQLSANDLKLIAWSAATPLDGAFAQPGELVGRTLLYPLAEGEPILKQYLAPAGSGAGFSSRIPEGMRALSLRSDEVAGVAGFATPGTHVDVLVTNHTTASGDPVTSIVLQDVPILAVGQKTQADPNMKPSSEDVVTLMVSPEDAEKVVRASAEGTVHFVLRNGADHQRVADAAPAPVAQDKRPARPAKVQAASAPKPYVLQMINGDKQTAETFQ